MPLPRASAERIKNRDTFRNLCIDLAELIKAAVESNELPIRIDADSLIAYLDWQPLAINSLKKTGKIPESFPRNKLEDLKQFGKHYYKEHLAWESR